MILVERYKGSMMTVPFRLPAVPQDHKLARRYIVQTILRHGATVVLAWTVILIFGLILAHCPGRDGDGNPAQGQDRKARRE